jgi:hypothetical protein
MAVSLIMEPNASPKVANYGTERLFRADEYVWCRSLRSQKELTCLADAEAEADSGSSRYLHMLTRQRLCSQSTSVGPSATVLRHGYAKPVYNCCHVTEHFWQLAVSLGACALGL